MEEMHPGLLEKSKFDFHKITLGISVQKAPDERNLSQDKSIGRCPAIRKLLWGLVHSWRCRTLKGF